MLWFWQPASSTPTATRPKTANELQAQDFRPSILYLRSFQDDARMLQKPTVLIPPTDSHDVGYRSTYEESVETSLGKALNEIGPLIAIGQPNTDLPDLGIPRESVGDGANWQDVVKIRMLSAPLVIARVGVTPGLSSELTELRRRVPPERIVLILPFDRDSYFAAVRQVRILFGADLPPYEMMLRCKRVSHAPAERLNVLGFLGFDENWEPQFMAIKGDTSSYTQGMRRSIEPLYVRLRVGKNKTDWSGTSLAGAAFWWPSQWTICLIAFVVTSLFFWTWLFLL